MLWLRRELGDVAQAARYSFSINPWGFTRAHYTPPQRTLVVQSPLCPSSFSNCLCRVNRFRATLRSVIHFSFHTQHSISLFSSFSYFFFFFLPSYFMFFLLSLLPENLYYHFFSILIFLYFILFYFFVPSFFLSFVSFFLPSILVNAHTVTCLSRTSSSIFIILQIN